MQNEAISVVKTDHREPMEFRVLTSASPGAPDHVITLSNAQFCRLAGSSTSPETQPETLVEAAFRFLLDRIPKEKITERFDLPAIGQYFPDFEVELPAYLARVERAASRMPQAQEGAAEAAPRIGHSTASPRA